jgi:hypothetical protein
MRTYLARYAIQDLYSYNVEQSRGDDVHNMVTVAMREMGLGVQEAVDHVGAQFRGIALAFCEDTKTLPEFPRPLDRLAAEYVAGMGLSIYTNVKWSFTSERYFG